MLDQITIEEQTEDEELLLAKESKILKHIKRENFKLIGVETPETKETCCICQVKLITLRFMKKIFL